MRAGSHDELKVLQDLRLALKLLVFTLILALAATTLFYLNVSDVTPGLHAVVPSKAQASTPLAWLAPDSTLIPDSPEGDMIRYGRELISHTAKYLGPAGKVRSSTNGMNCQNCHLRAGTVPFGNNYAAVSATYPKFRSRSGGMETPEKRVNDCIERSLNGIPLEEGSAEMRAILAYFRWLGKDVGPGITPPGAGIPALPFLTRPADPEKGKTVYQKHCLLCHGAEGRGFRQKDSLEWKYPPLAGPESFNTGAGLFRLSRMAGFVKSNMPYGTTYDNPVLSDEEAWDVAAYIASLPRPVKHFAGDWPDLATKPFDHPFGPYTDAFSESQHKYGPFDPILSAGKRNDNEATKDNTAQRRTSLRK